MDTRVISIIACTISIFSLASCCDDSLPDDIELLVPVKTYVAGDTISIGDTVWIDVNFHQTVSLNNSNARIDLPDFDFMIDIVLSEISSTKERFYFDV